jgi:ribose 5-phosphate isomerase A
MEAARDRAADAAVALVEDGMVVGLGTGDTSRRFIERLAKRVKAERLKIQCVVTSESAASRAREGGLRIRGLAEVARVDLAVDGADEVAPSLDLIKGAGGAHTREKIVAASAERFVVLVDASKLVHVLGEAFPVPVEVIPEAVPLVTRRLEALGAIPIARKALSGPGLWITELGNTILDARFARIEKPSVLAARMDGIPGVVEHGLFVGLASLVLVGDLQTESVRRLVPRSAGRRT